MNDGFETQTTQELCSQELASHGELAELCERRAATYALLARLFREELDEAALASLSATRFPAATGSEKVDEGIRLIVGYLSNAFEDVLIDLAVDYARTFLGGGLDGHSTAYPYESVYTSKKRLLMQDAYSEVLAQYRRQGIVREEGCKILEDHVALELEFMQVLSFRASEKLRSDDEEGAWTLLSDQRAFLDEHLLNWIGWFCTDMRSFSKTDFYRGLSLYLEGYVLSDKALLDAMVGEEDAL